MAEPADSPRPVSKELQTLREARKAIALAAVAFVVSIFIGFANPHVFDALLGVLEELVENIEGKGFAQVALFIFINNLKAAGMALLLGPVFGLIPIFQASANGVLIGIVAAETLASKGSLLIMLAVMPHGAFEIPAVVISWGLGIWLGSWPLLKDGRRMPERIKMAAGVFVRIVVPLLCIAAVIEAAFISTL